MQCAKDEAGMRREREEREKKERIGIKRPTYGPNNDREKHIINEADL
jgi:hypothetical protein